MIPASPRKLFCPHCKGKKGVARVISGNTFGGVFWSDGQSFTPMLPQASLVQKCPHCGKYYIISRQNDIGMCSEEMIMLGYDLFMTDEGRLTFPEMKEALAQLSAEGFVNAHEEEGVRLLFCRSFNDYYHRRDYMIHNLGPEFGSEKRYINELGYNADYEMFKTNVRWLLENCDVPDMMEAEFYREIGEMQKAMELIQACTPDDDVHIEMKNSIIQRIYDNDTRVFNLDGSDTSDYDVKFSLIDRDAIILDDYSESEMTDNEIREWKSLVSTVEDKGARTGMIEGAFSGLLKCDIPIVDLRRYKVSSDIMTGCVVDERGDTEQESLKQVGIENATPILVFQLLGAVTSKYYQHVIAEHLNVINSKLDDIIGHLESADRTLFERLVARLFDFDFLAIDRTKLRAAYERFVEISTKIKFDITDKVIVDNFSKDVNQIRLKYKMLLKNSEKKLYASLDRIYKGKTEQLLKALEESRYLNYLDLALQTELLYFIVSLVSMRVAESLGNEEDAKIYVNRLNFNFWDNYIGQARAIRSKIVWSLDGLAESKSPSPESEKIYRMKAKIQVKFDEMEIKMMKLEKQLICRTQIVLQVQDNGEMKKLVLCGQS